MKFFLVLLFAVILFVGCTDVATPSFKIISEESQLPVNTTDSVEYYKSSERDIWDFGQRTPFRAILYFNSEHYQNILQKIKRDSIYKKITDKGQKQKVYNAFFKELLSPPPICSLQKPMYVYHTKKSGSTIFCNRIHFRYSTLPPFN